MRRKKRVRIISTRTVMCNILLHYTRANCICCIYIYIFVFMFVCICVYSIHNIHIYIYTPIHACTHWYMLEYFDSGRLADAGGGWCLVTALISEAASHFWFKTSRAAADWTKHTPYNPIYQILLFQTSPIIQTKIFLDSKVMPYSNSSTFSLAFFGLLMRNYMGIR